MPDQSEWHESVKGRDVATSWVITFWVYSRGRSLLLISTSYIYYILCKLSYQQIKQILKKSKLNTPIDETKILKDRYVAPAGYHRYGQLWGCW